MRFEIDLTRSWRDRADCSTMQLANRRQNQNISSQRALPFRFSLLSLRTYSQVSTLSRKMPLEKCSNKIRRIVRIRQMLRRWRARASSSSSSSRSPPSPPHDVPSGHIAVVVGSGRRRYVVRAAYLNHPVFASLLVRAEEEYGFSQPGPLSIPCDESLFEEAVGLVTRSEPGRSVRRPPVPDKLRRCCHAGSTRLCSELVAESRPLLNGI